MRAQVFVGARSAHCWVAALPRAGCGGAQPPRCEVADYVTLPRTTIPAAQRLRSTAADSLLRQYDAVESLRRESEKTMVAEARKASISKLLATVPGLGPIRVANLMAIIVSPHRFRTRRQVWEYCGLGVVTRSSSDWVQGDDGKWRKGQVQQTRGLNRHHNHELKSIFKGAATTVIKQARKDCPIYQHYVAMLNSKIKPNLAKLTIARQIAAVTLSLWKKEARYDPAKLTKNS